MARHRFFAAGDDAARAVSIKEARNGRRLTAEEFAIVEAARADLGRVYDGLSSISLPIAATAAERIAGAIDALRGAQK